MKWSAAVGAATAPGRRANRVWLVQGSDTASHADPEGLARAWLAANFRLVARLRERGYNGDVDVTLYER